MTEIDLRMCDLVQSFPTLRRTPESLFVPWDPEAFAEYWAVGSGGEKDAALFVLSVWNPSTDWEQQGLTRGASELGIDDGGRFNLHRALGNWDDKHRAAFIAWCKEPWWA
jgi:hypothetical protein